MSAIPSSGEVIPSKILGAYFFGARPLTAYKNVSSYILTIAQGVTGNDHTHKNLAIKNL